MTTTRDPHAPVTMQCMEVWGGNQAVSSGVVMPGLDAWVYSRPYEGDNAGGDIHYVSSCATGNITRLLIADVSGHGSGVAQIASTLRTLMRRFVNVIDQTKLMRSLNAEFASISEAGGFATAVVATYWAPDNALIISNAGHPRPLVYRARERQWERLDFKPTSTGLANIPLGIAEPTLYDEARFGLEAEDLVLFYTDALAEATDATGHQLGEPGLLRILSTLDPAAPESLPEAFVNAVRAASNGDHLGDDVTALLVRPNAVKPRILLDVFIRAIAKRARALVSR